MFPNLAAYNEAGAPRADLLAILLTGIPTGVVPGFQNYTGTAQADMLRLNMAIPPTASGPSNLGLIGGDPAGFPTAAGSSTTWPPSSSGPSPGPPSPWSTRLRRRRRRRGDPMGLTSGPTDLTAMGTENYLTSSPTSGTPISGFDALTAAS